MTAWMMTLLLGLLLTAPAFGQTPGVWEELPNTRLDQSAAVCGNPGALPPPDCVPLSLPGGGNNLFGNILGSWNGAAYDTSRRQLVVPATGGHNDWAGNQVFAFFVPSVSWRLLKAHSTAYPVVPAPSVCPYADGSPCSNHTYDAVAYLPDQDAIWTGGGFRWYDAGWNRQTWWFLPSSATWTQKALRPLGGGGMASAWDPRTRRLIYRDQAGLKSYDPAADTTGQLSTLCGSKDSFAEEMSTAALDVEGRRFYRIRRKQASSPAGTAVRMIDLNNLAACERIIQATGDLEIEPVRGAGLIFHAGSLVAYGKTADGLNGALYRLRPDGPAGLRVVAPRAALRGAAAQLGRRVPLQEVLSRHGRRDVLRGRAREPERVADSLPPRRLAMIYATGPPARVNAPHHPPEPPGVTSRVAGCLILS